MLFYFLTSGISAQPHTNAVVTDIVFVRKTNVNLTENSFPFYFNQMGFINDVQSDIKKYIGEKFNVPAIEFSYPDSINYYSILTPQKISVRQKAKDLGGKNTLYVGVETMISYGGEFNGIKTYRFTTKVFIYTGNGKSYYKFKSIIPFETYAGEDISGKVQMNDIDFYTFYFDGLKMAFDGPISWAEHRYVARPAADYYSSFLNISEKFYLNFDDNNYRYGSEFSNMIPVLSINDSNVLANNGEFNFANVIESKLIKDGLQIQNRISKTNKIVKLRLVTYSFTNNLVHNTGIITNYLKPNGDTSATFIYDWYNSISAKFDTLYYKLQVNTSYNCCEIYASDTLLCLINEFPDKRVFFVHSAISLEQLTIIVDLVFAYDFSLALKEWQLSLTAL